MSKWLTGVVSEVGKGTGEVRQLPKKSKTKPRGGKFERGWGLSWEVLGGAGGAWLEPDNQATQGNVPKLGRRPASHAAKQVRSAYNCTDPGETRGKHAQGLRASIWTGLLH